MEAVNNKNEEITIRDFVFRIIKGFRYLKTKWLFILVGSVIGAAIGFTKAYLSKPIYKAELTFALEEKGASGNYAGIASQFGIDIGGAGGGAFVGENNIELMKSRNIIEKALLLPIIIDGKKELLINRYIEFNKLRETNLALEGVIFAANEDRSKFDENKNGILDGIHKTIKWNDLTVQKTDKKLSIISVIVKSKDELFAKLFTEVLVNTASDLYIQTKISKSKKNLYVLENRLDSVKALLDFNMHDAAASKDQNMYVIRARGNVSQAQKQLNVQILTTMYIELVRNVEIAKYTLMREEPLVQIIDTPILPLDKTKLGNIKGSIIGLISGAVLISFILILIRLTKTFFKTD